MMIHLASRSSQSHLSTFEPGDVQPNAIDLRVDKIFEVNRDAFRISEGVKSHRGSFEMEPDKESYWRLEPGFYEIIMQGEIKLGPDEAGFVITRSTLNRNGLYITSGLYDSGYHGVMAGALHVEHGTAYIQKGTRVAQFLLWRAQSLMQYDGDYGIGKEHDAKYVHEPSVDDPSQMYYYANGKRYEFVDGELREKEEQLELGFEVVEDSNPRFHLASGAGYEEYHPDKAKEKDAAIARTKHTEGHNS